LNIAKKYEASLVGQECLRIQAPNQNRTCATNAYGSSHCIHSLSIKQTYLN